jgi:hypothetical protein
VSVKIPLNKREMERSATYLSLYNEVFLNHQKTYFDRNRLYGALGYVLRKDLKIELGFMNQTVANSGRNQFQIVIFNDLPFNKSNSSEL